MVQDMSVLFTGIPFPIPGSYPRRNRTRRNRFEPLVHRTTHKPASELFELWIRMQIEMSGAAP